MRKHRKQDGDASDASACANASVSWAANAVVLSPLLVALAFSSLFSWAGSYIDAGCLRRVASSFQLVVPHAYPVSPAILHFPHFFPYQLAILLFIANISFLSPVTSTAVVRYIQFNPVVSQIEVNVKGLKHNRKSSQ